MAYANSDNQTVTGILTLSSAGVSTGSTVTQHGVVVGGSSNTVTSTAVGSTGQVLQANSAADPTYSTATYPSVATSTGTILRANGTNWVATTATYPTTTTATQLLYSSATNVIGEVTTSIDGVLISSHASGTPSWLANGTAGFVLTAQSGAPPAWAAASGGWVATPAAFTAYLSSNATNATGDGTGFYITFDSTTSNIGSVYSTGTGLFTAPATGNYWIDVTVACSGITVATNYNILMTEQSSGSTFQSYGQVLASSGSETFKFSQLIHCSAGETFSCTFTVSGGTKTVTVVGGSAAQATQYSAFRVS